MGKKFAAFAVLVLVVSLVGFGCDDSVLNPKEKIVFENHSHYDGVNCYVNSVYKGTVNSGYKQLFEGDFEGKVVLYADGPATWGPVTYYVGDGASFSWKLTD